MTDLLAAAAPASLEPARLWALIPCAGTGSRAIAPDAPAPELPKQYHLVAGAPMVAHTLAAFAGAARVHHTLVVIAPGELFSVSGLHQQNLRLSNTFHGQPNLDIALTAISEALDVPTTYFYSLPKPKALDWVTRPDERRTLYLAGGITDIMASPTLQGAFMVVDSLLEPGASSGERQMSDRSEQAGYVLEGQLTLWLGEDEESATLYPGDAFQVPSYARLRYANQGDTPARVLWIYT